jgi:hypothetical protein
MKESKFLYNSDGYTIALTEDQRFELRGPELRSDAEVFDTYKQAIEKMTKVTSATAKRVKRNLALPVLVKTGGRYNEKIKLAKAVLTGAHSTRGVLLTRPSTDTGSYSGFEAYPDVPVVQELLDERAKLALALAAVEKKLNECEIEEPGYKIRGRDYDEALSDLEKAYADAKAAAEAIAVKRVQSAEAA